jgi:hypothetical protein
MKDRINRWWKSGRQTVTSQADQALAHSCAGRVVNALTLIVVVICLGLWITAFLLLKDRLFAQTLTGSILTNLTCLTFFGGLVLAWLAGTLIGNFLRRLFWKLLTNQGRQK